MQVDHPEILVRAALAISNSIRRGTPRQEQSISPGRIVLRRIEASYPGVDWPQRLVRAGTPGDLAEALRGLRRLDPETAANAVETKLEFLAQRVKVALREPQLAIELLAAIESTAPGEGRTLLARMTRFTALELGDRGPPVRSGPSPPRQGISRARTPRLFSSSEHPGCTAQEMGQHDPPDFEPFGLARLAPHVCHLGYPYSRRARSQAIDLAGGTAAP